MVTVPLPNAQLMTFVEFIDWKPDNRRYELHHGTPIEMQPTGDHVREASSKKLQAMVGWELAQSPSAVPVASDV